MCRACRPGHHKIEPEEDPHLIAEFIAVDLAVREIADLLGLGQVVVVLRPALPARAVGSHMKFAPSGSTTGAPWSTSQQGLSVRFCGVCRLGPMLLFQPGDRNKAMIVFVGVFDRLDAEKRRTEDHRQQDQDDLHIPVAFLRVVNRQRHRQAADDQDERIQAAPERVEMITAGGKRHRELRTEDQIRRKQPAEEHDLLHEEHPHPDRDALFLLPHVFELVLKTRLVVMIEFVQCIACVASFDMRLRITEFQDWTRNRYLAWLRLFCVPLQDPGRSLRQTHMLPT